VTDRYDKIILAVLFIVLAGLVTFLASGAYGQEPPKAPPPRSRQFTNVESLELQLLMERQASLDKDRELFVRKACESSGIPMAQCAVDPRAGTVAERPAPPKPADAKPAKPAEKKAEEKKP